MLSCGRLKSVKDMIHANRYMNMKLPIPVVTIFFLSDLGKLIFICFAMKQVIRKRTIINIIDVHLCSSLSSIPSKRKVAAIPPITANTTRIQKSLSVRFLVMLTSSVSIIGSPPDFCESVDGASRGSFGSGVHLPAILSSDPGSGSACSFTEVSSCSGENFFFISYNFCKIHHYEA